MKNLLLVSVILFLTCLCFNLGTELYMKIKLIPEYTELKDEIRRLDIEKRDKQFIIKNELEQTAEKCYVFLMENEGMMVQYIEDKKRIPFFTCLINQKSELKPIEPKTIKTTQP